MDNKLPIDLLPVEKPFLEDSKYTLTYFYDNVIKYLIPDIIKIEANGIPINLQKVTKLDEQLIIVINQVNEKLAKNEFILKFLEQEYSSSKSQIITKQKTESDFIKPCDLTKIAHRTYVINYYLKQNDKEDMCLDKWTIKDLKILNQIIASNFINSLITTKNINDIASQYKIIIDNAMIQFAKDKAEIYNKNHIETKISNLTNTITFNPNSPPQKQRFFEFYNVESESETPAGNEKWDRKELERLQLYLNILIENKEK